MRLEAEECLTEDYVGGDVEDGVGHQMVKLEVVEIQKPLREGGPGNPNLG